MNNAWTLVWKWVVGGKERREREDEREKEKNSSRKSQDMLQLYLPLHTSPAGIIASPLFATTATHKAYGIVWEMLSQLYYPLNSIQAGPLFLVSRRIGTCFVSLRLPRCLRASGENPFPGLRPMFFHSSPFPSLSRRRNVYFIR